MEKALEFAKKLASKQIKLSLEDGKLSCYAPKGLLTKEIQDDIIKFKPEIINLIKGKEKFQLPFRTHRSEKNSSIPVEFPLSAGEQGLYILQKISPEMSAYNIPLCFRISNEVNLEVLQKAWSNLLKLYPILTARIIEKKGTLFHILDDKCKTSIRQQAINFEDDQQTLDFLRNQVKRPFDLNNGPLTRFKLFTQKDDDFIILLTLHHIIFDGTSAVILLNSLFSFYQQLCEGKEISFSQELPGYQDFVAWENQMLASEEGQSHAEYWQEQLSGELQTLELLPDLPRLVTTSYEGKTLTKELPEKLSNWTIDFSRSQSLQTSVVFLSAFQLLLHKYTNQKDIIVGMPVMGRVEEKFAEDIGFFINMVPIRTNYDKTAKFSEVLRDTQATMLDALYHSSYPFPLMLDKLKLIQGAKNPIFQVSYSYQNFIPEYDSESLSQQKALGLKEVQGIHQEGDFDLGLEVYENQGSFTLHLKYNPQLYTQDSIERLFERYCELLKSISNSPDLLPHDYSIVTKQEINRLLVDNNQTETSYPQDKCIYHLFEEQLVPNASKTAVVHGENSLSYQQLYDKSQTLALYLQSKGIGPDSLVGLCVERSLDMMVGLLGILQAGGAYVPLDPDYPDDRLGYMLEDSRTTIVMTQDKLRNRLDTLISKGTQLITLDNQWEEISESVIELKRKKVKLRREVKPENLAYVIYTSGSTGRPKGVMVEHNAVVNFLHSMADKPGLDREDKLLAVTTYCFDIAGLELFLPLVKGAQLCICADEDLKDGEKLKNAIKNYQPTIMQATPATWQLLFYAGWKNDENLKVLCGGETLSERLKSDFAKVKSNVWNMFGPTETTVWSTISPVKENKIINIGTPIRNTQIYILDQDNKPQGVGMPGELHIGGEGLARGYLNRPELTAEKFISNPFNLGARLYKSGDLARWLPDGNIEYLGRIDAQVKIRGFRIETGEIEKTLNQHPEIINCVVVAQGEETNKQLIAFYLAKRADEGHFIELSSECLKAHLQQSLPEYMLPIGFVSLEVIPLMPNGKVDRRALEQMDVSLDSNQVYRAPEGDTEKLLAEIWSQVLNLESKKIGVNDNFFELGGHSLLATKLLSKIRERFEIEISLKKLFEQGSISELAQLITTTAKSQFLAISPINRDEFDFFALSFSQERLWFIDQLEPGSNGYNAPEAVTIFGDLDAEQVEKVFNQIIERHENLRTIFPNIKGQPQQIILDKLDFKIERVDLSHYKSKLDRHSKAKQICQDESTKPFNLAKGPLLRGMVIKIASDEHILLLNIHHIISDGWSIGLLIKEFKLIMSALEQGLTADLPPLPIQYVDYSVWQRQWLEQSGLLDQQLDYWERKLDGIPESLNLSTDFARPNQQSIAGATQFFMIDVQLAEKLKNLAEQQGCTLYITLLTIFKVLLYRYTGQEDICVGSVIANRQYGETENLIGMFINTLALRNQIVNEDKFTSILNAVKKTCLEAYDNQDTPFEKVVERVQPQRNRSITPLFQVLFVLQNAPMDLLEDNTQPYPLEHGTSKFDLALEVTETQEGLKGSIEYSTALFKKRTIDRVIENFIGLCRAVVAKPTSKIRDFDYISKTEKQQLLFDYNQTKAEYPKDKCIHELFVEQVERNPDKTAVIFEEESLSYKQLLDRCEIVALYLQSLGVRPDTIVGLCVERSIDMMVGIMGIVQAGGAYLPLDPDYPDERVSYLLEDSRAGIVLTQEKFENQLNALVTNDVKLVLLDKQSKNINERVEELRAKKIEITKEVNPDNLNYVIYTSGSTGQPKGVLVEHAALVNRIHWMQKLYPLTGDDVVLQKTPYSFDVSVWEFFWPMVTGATVAFAVPDGHTDVHYLENFINEKHVTTLHYVPSMLHTFLDNAKDVCKSIKQVFCSGEALDRKSVDNYQTKFPNASLHNLYGPTEAAIDVTAYDCSQLNYSFVPIGSPIDNIQLYILDQQNNLQPLGAPGELHIAGDGLARGYLNRPELTQEKFIANPFTPGSRMYKTGDLARWMDDGNIQYLGRIDGQVKISGVRIETGEIESHLNKHAEISDSVVVAHGKDGYKQLIAFYQAQATRPRNKIDLSSEKLRKHLLKTIPEYMIPAAFVSIETIPLTSNGKVNRRALSTIKVSIESTREYLAPSNKTEEQLVDIWAQVFKEQGFVLEKAKIGVNDDFFELGGNSLLATQLIYRIRNELTADLPVRALFDHTTIAEIAALVQAILAQSEVSLEDNIVSDDDAEFEDVTL